MMRLPSRPLSSLLLLAVAGCAGASGSPAAGPTPAAVARAAARPASPADIHFMSGMIPHHAQATLIAGWAESHGAGPALRVLAQRIVVGQADEIALMQQWLGDHGQPVPAADATHLRMEMGGMVHDMRMPGMLNDEELALLDAARGPEFDRLFLTFMIGHHQGAIMMVDELFASQDAANDDVVYKMAADIWADQNIEIERMKNLLAAQP
jgi:uncharacterized protein (DUF305 family)